MWLFFLCGQCHGEVKLLEAIRDLTITSSIDYLSFLIETRFEVGVDDLSVEISYI